MGFDHFTLLYCTILVQIIKKSDCVGTCKKKPNLGESWADKTKHLWRIRSYYEIKQAQDLKDKLRDKLHNFQT